MDTNEHPCELKKDAVCPIPVPRTPKQISAIIRADLPRERGLVFGRDEWHDVATIPAIGGKIVTVERHDQ